MVWYALEEIEEAVQETKSLLLPFDLGTWARLLLIVILTGSGFSFPNFPSSFPGDSGHTYEETDYAPGDIPAQSMEGALNELPATGLATSSATGIWIGIGLVFMALVLLFIYLSSVFEFIFYQSLLDRDVSIRSNFRLHSGKGLSYFGFRILTTLVIFASVAGMILAFLASPVAGILLLLAFLAGIIPFIIFLGLTQNFVLLQMIEDGTGIIQAWKNFYPSLKNEWQQVAVYVVVRFVIQIVAATVAILWALLTLLVLLIPFGIIGAIAYLIFPPLVWFVVVLGIVAWMILLLAVQVPIQSYLYYYAILVYHDLTS